MKKRNKKPTRRAREATPTPPKENTMSLNYRDEARALLEVLITEENSDALIADLLQKAKVPGLLRPFVGRVLDGAAPEALIDALVNLIPDDEDAPEA